MEYVTGNANDEDDEAGGGGVGVVLWFLVTVPGFTLWGFSIRSNPLLFRDYPSAPFSFVKVLDTVRI